MRSDLVSSVKCCKSGLPFLRSIPSAGTSVSALDVRWGVTHLDAVMRSRILIYKIGNLRRRSGAMNFTFQTFGRVQTMTPSLYRHALHTNSKSNLNFSALNRMRDVADSHQTRGA